MSAIPPAPMPDVQAKDSLYTELQALDRETHRQLRLNRSVVQDYSATRGMNALFTNAVEFMDVCREYPIVFVRAGEAKPGEMPTEVAPMAVVGLKRGENLFLQDDNSWSASYVPASVRAYPFGLVRTDASNYVVCFDRAWTGFSEQEGERLFKDDGQPTEFTLSVQKYLETLDQEMQRTQHFGRRLLELGLLQDMRFDATLEGGQNLVVDGFLAINEQKFNELPDATVLELHRSGMLALIHAQIISMGNMRRLVERRLQLKLPV